MQDVTIREKQVFPVYIYFSFLVTFYESLVIYKKKRF